MSPQQKITTALLAAKLAKEVLELLTMHDRFTVRLQFKQIVMDLRALQEHIDTL